MRKQIFLIKQNRKRIPGKYFYENFDFIYDDEYQEERERSNSRYSRSKKIKIHQKDFDGQKIKHQNFLFSSNTKGPIWT